MDCKLPSLSRRAPLPLIQAGHFDYEVLGKTQALRYILANTCFNTHTHAQTRTRTRTHVRTHLRTHACTHKHVLGCASDILASLGDLWVVTLGCDPPLIQIGHFDLYLCLANNEHHSARTDTCTHTEAQSRMHKHACAQARTHTNGSAHGSI